MPRYSERTEREWIDLFEPFESTISQDEIYNACAVISRIENDGRVYFKNDAQAGLRWEKGCNDLSRLVSNFSYRLQVERTDFADLLWEFMREFSHTEKRLHQLLFSDAISQNQRVQFIREVWDWFSVALRFAVRGALLAHKGKGNKTV